MELQRRNSTAVTGSLQWSNSVKNDGSSSKRQIKKKTLNEQMDQYNANMIRSYKQYHQERSAINNTCSKINIYAENGLP